MWICCCFLARGSMRLAAPLVLEGVTQIDRLDVRKAVPLLEHLVGVRVRARVKGEG